MTIPVSCLILLIATCTSLSEPGWFHFEGKEYHTSIDLQAALTLPQWDVGKSEPPIGANKAYNLAKEKLAAQFGKLLRLELESVSLIHLKSDDKRSASLWAVDFKQIFSEKEVMRSMALGEKNESIKIRYIVLMDGSIAEPKPVN